MISKEVIKDSDSINETIETLRGTFEVRTGSQEVVSLIEKTVHSHYLPTEDEVRDFLSFYERVSARIVSQKKPLLHWVNRIFIESRWVNY